jgi:hypothetical protein
MTLVSVVLIRVALSSIHIIILGSTEMLGVDERYILHTHTYTLNTILSSRKTTIMTKSTKNCSVNLVCKTIDINLERGRSVAFISLHYDVYLYSQASVLSLCSVCYRRTISQLRYLVRIKFLILSIDKFHDEQLFDQTFGKK